jgi:hypothetical protein
MAGPDRLLVATKTRLRVLWPALIALGVGCLYAGWRLAAADWDARSLAELPGEAATAQGYDGQFTYYIALDPSPLRVSSRLDVPSYRYQRILYPLLARFLALGNAEAIPWSLVAVNIMAQFLGTWAVAEALAGYGVWPGYALAYGLWVGLVVGVGTDLTEPCAYALAAAGWLALQRDRDFAAPALFGLGLFAKETIGIFWAAAFAADVIQKAPRRRLIGMVAGGSAFGVWQLWLWRTFGTPGLGSGGALATPFEWVPFMGLWRIATVSVPVLLVFVLIFGPSVVLPSSWGIFASLRSARNGARQPEVFALLLNAAVIPFLPFSTFREPLGIVRVASGLVLATLLFAGRYNLRRPLNYSLFWSGLLVILLNG